MSSIGGFFAPEPPAYGIATAVSVPVLTSNFVGWPPRESQIGDSLMVHLPSPVLVLPMYHICWRVGPLTFDLICSTVRSPVASSPVPVMLRVRQKLREPGVPNPCIDQQPATFSPSASLIG